MVKSRALRRKKSKRQQSQAAEETDQPEQTRAETVASNFRNDELTELCRIWNISDVSEVSPLVAAVALNKVALVKRLIGDDYNVELRGPGGRTALLEAVRMRSLELVDVLAAHGADSCATDANGNTAPMLALADEWWTQDAMLALCGLLPNFDVDRAASVGKGHTLLHHAVRRNWDALLDVLLERHAQVDCVTLRGVSPLMFAGCSRRWQLAQRLLLAGANLLLEDVHGCTALCYACATLLVKERNRETIELLLRHLPVPVEDYVLRRLHLLRHPPCAAVDFAGPVSSIIALALYCLSRHVRDGLRALLGVNVFAHISRTIDAHIGCVDYAHALLGLLFDLARHCACCTELAGVAAAQLAVAFVGGGAPDACLAVLLAHCVPTDSALLPDPLMRLLVAALLPLAVVFGRSPEAGVDWLKRRGDDLAPFYAIFRRATHISVSSRTDLAHLRIVRRQLRNFHALYASEQAPHRVALSTETQIGAHSESSIESVEESATSLKGSRPSAGKVESAESSLSLVDSSIDCSTQEGWKEVIRRGTKNSRKNKKIVQSKSHACLLGTLKEETNDSPPPTLKTITKARSESSLKKKEDTQPPSEKTENESCEKSENIRVTLLPVEKVNVQPSTSSKESPDSPAETKALSETPTEAPIETLLEPKVPRRRERRSCRGAPFGSTPKKSRVRSERARRKDAEALEAYRMLPRSLDFGKDDVSKETVGKNQTLRSTVDSDLCDSLEPAVDTPLIVLYESKGSYHNKSKAEESEAAEELPVDNDDDYEDEHPKEHEESLDLDRSVESPNSLRLSEVDNDIKEMLSSLEVSVRGLYPSQDDADKSGATPKKSRANRIQVRLSDRRRLTVVDDLFTALVDALTARWRAEHAADYPGHRVLLSAGQDTTLSHLNRLLPPLERLHLARLVRRWRALSRKLRTTETADSATLVGRLGTLLQSHLSALAPGSLASSSALKRRASRHDTALRKRMRVGEATVSVRKQRTVRRRTLKTLGERTHNLKVIVPRSRAKTVNHNVTVIEPRDAQDVGTQSRCLRVSITQDFFPDTHYYQAPCVNTSIPPPPGFESQHFPSRTCYLQAAVNSGEFMPLHKGVQYMCNAVNVGTPLPAGRVEEHSSVDDFASVRGVVDHLHLDDDTDFEDFLQRKQLAGNGLMSRDDRVLMALMRECTQEKEGSTEQLHQKWIPLRQPLRATLVQDVASLRDLRHENLVAWETVKVSAAGLRIGCARMQFNLNELLVDSDFKLEASRLLDLCHQMARGLRFLHSMSQVHGNLKPTNVLLDEWGVARLSDFGLHLLKPPAAVACLWWASETRAQFARRSQLLCTKESDAQVLGMLFYYAATRGRHPFVGSSTTLVDWGSASYELRQLTQDLLQHESALRPTMRTTLRHVCWWDAHDRRSLVLRCASWLADGCAEQSLFLDTALEPLLPNWRVRAVQAMGRAAPDTPSALLRRLHAAPHMADAMLRLLPELPLALHRLAAQTPSLRALLRFVSHSTLDTA